MFPLCLIRICILLLVGEVFYICLLGPIGSQCCSNPILLTFYLVVLSIIETGMLKSPIIMLLFLSSILSKFASSLGALIVHLHFGW